MNIAQIGPGLWTIKTVHGESTVTQDEKPQCRIEL